MCLLILFSRKIGELQDEVEFWQGQYADCKAQMEGFLKQTDVVTFEDGRYTDSQRSLHGAYVYESWCKERPEDHQDSNGENGRHFTTTTSWFNFCKVYAVGGTECGSFSPEGRNTFRRR